MFTTRTQRVLVVAVAAALVTAGSVVAARALTNGSGQSDIAKVRAAVAEFHQTEAARAAGWDLVEGLDHCFESEAGGMGFHYINVDRLDTSLDPMQPEALVYQQLPNAELQLGAVEYIVPAAAWDSEGHGGLPTLLGHEFHLNEALGVYVLHAWIFSHNPAGMFEDWNPRVSCLE